MELSRNLNREAEVFQKIKDYFTIKDAGKSDNIKLSDLLYPKQAYFQKKFPLPITDDEVNYYVIGRGHEEVVHKYTGYFKPESKQWNGIWYGVDFMITDKPIEMKTRRGWLAKEGEERERYESYLKQLVGYCACEGINQGELWIWSLLEPTDEFRSAPKMVCYDVNFTQEEIEKEQLRLLQMKDCLLHALDWDTVSHTLLPDCPEWKCYRKKTTMLTVPKCISCDREFKTDYGIKSHINSSKGKGHKVIFATYNVEKIPSCKWLSMCKGEGDEEKSEKKV